MVRVKRPGGGGPTKKAKGRGTKKRKREDLEDLYHSVVEKEREEKKQRKLERRKSKHQQNNHVGSSGGDLTCSDMFERAALGEGEDLEGLALTAQSGLSQLLGLLSSSVTTKDSDGSSSDEDDKSGVELDDHDDGDDYSSIGGDEAEEGSETEDIDNDAESGVAVTENSLPYQIVGAGDPKGDLADGESDSAEDDDTEEVLESADSAGDDLEGDNELSSIGRESEDEGSELDVGDSLDAGIELSVEGVSSRSLSSSVVQAAGDIWSGFSFTSFNEPLPEDAGSPAASSRELEKMSLSLEGFSEMSLARSKANEAIAQLLEEMPRKVFREYPIEGTHSAVRGEGGSEQRVCPLPQGVPAPHVKKIRALWRAHGSKVGPEREAFWRKWLGEHPECFTLFPLSQTTKDACEDRSYFGSSQARTFYSLLSAYVDIQCTTQNFVNAVSMRSLLALHITSHIIQSRLMVSGNSAKVKAAVERQQAAAATLTGGPRRNKRKRSNRTNGLKVIEDNSKPTERTLRSLSSPGDLEGGGAETLDVRDAGFTRPRVLALLPTKHAAKEMIELLLSLHPKGNVKNRRKFDREFSPEADDDDDAGIGGLKIGKERNKTADEEEENGISLLQQNKPPDFAERFRGNSSDNFRIGIRFYAKGACLYSPLYESDIILASPLGLRLLIGDESTETRDFDYLSSIEVLFVDQADALKMQNWEHVVDIFTVLNRVPIQWRSDCDIRRLRQSCADGQMRRYRQTIVLQSGADPEINALFKIPNNGETVSKGSDQPMALCCNFRGMVRLRVPTKDERLLREAGNYAHKQLVLRVACPNLEELHEKMLHFFTRHFPPTHLPIAEAKNGILLVIPSYVEYLRIAKVLKENSRLQENERINVTAACHEYSSKKMLSRSRQAFHSGRVNLLIVTERLLHFRRYKIKGASHVVFYGAPSHPLIYLECLQSLQQSNAVSQFGHGPTSLIYATDFHAPALERILAVDKCAMVLKTPAHMNKLFVFGGT